MKAKVKKNRRGGFSLLELLAVVSILGVIAAVVIPRVTSSKDKAAENVNLQNIAEINAAVERYYLLEDAWPASLKDLNNEQYFPEGIPVNPVDQKPYTLNEDTHRVVNTSASSD